MLQPESLYQLHDYSRLKHNFKNDLAPKKPLQVYVVLKEITENGFAKCSVYWYLERPRFIPTIRKGLIVFLPTHFLRVPSKYANLHTNPNSWLSAMESELENEARKLAPQILKAAFTEVTAATKLVRPEKLTIKKGQVWVNPKDKSKVIVLDVSYKEVVFQEHRKVNYVKAQDFINKIDEKGYLLEIPSDNILDKIMDLVRPYIPAALVSLLAGWLASKMGVFASTEVTAALDEMLQDKIENWYEQFTTVDTYEDMQKLIDIFIDAEGLDASQHIYINNYVNQLRHDEGLKRL